MIVQHRAATISATEAVVAAYATGCLEPIVLTSDPDDLTALVEHTRSASSSCELEGMLI